ncbi:hypothetical protein LJR074_001955 [Acidovorax sp. LjRoot74]|uniref:LexA family protein n=1 Tax=Acidovorax sp. LjRoot74 TaxID=3342337 RepID=UPI003ED16AB3
MANENPFVHETRAANAIAASLRPGRAPLSAPKSRKAQGLTPRQGEVLAYLHEFFADNDQIPPVSAVGKRFGIRPGAAQWHMDQLLHHGAIERNTVGRWRFARRGEITHATP